MSVEWSEFARRLGRELAGLERDTILIVRERDESRHYVQAMREPDRLYAEAVSNNFLDGPLLLTLADEEVMSDAGWRPPAEPAPRNWWTELPAYATAADHGRLADVMVTALRDVQGVRRPSDLVYESFHRHGTGLIELLDFGIEAADPSRVTKQRRTSADIGESATPEDHPNGVRGAVPALAAPVPGAYGAEPQPVPEEPDTLEPRLADAKGRGDHTTYFELLLTADLVLPSTAPAVEDPEAAEFPTIVIGGGTYMVVFTSPQALVRSGHRPGLYRRTSFTRLALAWPDPAWQLAINPGLPSEVHLDAAAVARLDATQRSPGRHSAPASGAPAPGDDPAPGGPVPVDPVPVDPVPVDPVSEIPGAPGAGEGVPSAPPRPIAPPPPAPPAVQPPAAPPSAAPPSAAPPSAAPVATPVPPPTPPARTPAPALPVSSPDVPPVASAIPLRPPHGTRLWRWDGDGDEAESAVPAAIFDAIAGSWSQVRADAVQAPHTD